MTILYETDTLIIGTGAAGLRAAAEAHERGVRVLLVSKSRAGHNNCTIVAGAGYIAAVGGMTPEEHRELTLSVGKGVNDPKLVDVLTEEGGGRVLELRRFGLDVKVGRGCVHVGDTETRLGQGITLPMVKYLKDRGVPFVDNIIVTRLLKEDDRIVGAVGYSSDDKQPIVFSAKAVILATGGAGAIYRRTDCPLKTTGDGYSLAYHAGARLRDMEFVQFFPLSLAEPGAPPLLVDGALVEQGKIINVMGEEIPVKYKVTERPFIARSRDLLSRAIMVEILEGGGVEGAVLIDGREVMKRAKPGDSFGMGSYEFYRDRVGAQERPFRVAPLSHFCMGGIVTNTWGETDVRGLSAAGEVVGGTHGANRYGGNALTEATVFGARAGARAAEYAASVEHGDAEALSEPEQERYKRITGREQGYRPVSVMAALRETMWDKAGVIRDSGMLVEAYEKVQELRESSGQMLAQQGKPMMAALEVGMALDAAEMIIRSAMERRESRGAHYRRDHPYEDPAWRRTITLFKKGDAMELATVALGEAFE
jgi:succinate dehydrogenase/fumarate reductase flavoprotein subunit